MGTDEEPSTVAGPRARRGLHPPPVWGLLAAILLAVGVFGAWSRASEYRDLDAEQRHLLATQALAIDENLTRQLLGAGAALRGMRQDLAAWPERDLGPRATRRLKALSDAMPGVRTMLLLDRTGRVLASSRPELQGQEFSHRPYFTVQRDDPDPQRIALSPPFLNVLGVYSMSLSIGVVAADGSFGGAIVATLDPEYFQTLLRTVLYASDARASVAHGDGPVMIVEPPVEKLVGTSFDQPGSYFRRHRESGQRATLLTGTAPAAGERRMVAQRTVQPQELALDRPLVVAVSRDMDAMFAPWRRQTGVDTLLYLLFAATTSLALLAMQRRRREIEALEAQREALMRQGAERLELALRGADLGLWDLHVPSNTAIVDERWNAMLGLPHQSVDPGAVIWSSRVHPEDWPRVLQAEREHLEGRSERFDEVYRMRHADGHWVWVLDRAKVLERDATGAPLRMVGTHMDTTPWMEGQLALERSEQSLATTLHSIGDAVIATDPRGVIVRINATAERMTGWDAAAAIGRPLSEVFRIFEAHSREPVADPVQKVVDEGRIVDLSHDTLLVARDGTEHQIADSAAPIRTPGGAITGVVLVFSDVSERYRVQQALLANEQRLRSLLDNLGSGVIVHGADTRVLDANPAACRICGLSLDQMRGKVAIDPYWSFLEEDRSPMELARYPVPQVLARNDAVRSLVLGVRRADLPVPVWVLVNAYPVRDAEDRIEQVVVTFSDISERKEAEERLQAARSELQATLEAVPDLLFELDLDGRIHNYHSPRHDLLHAPPAEFLGRTVSEVLPAAAAAVAMAALREAHETGFSAGRHYELALPDGVHGFELSVARKPAPEGETPRFIVLARDISERLLAEHRRAALELQLRQAQRMESIGTLAGGIAHDFNNILAAILGHVSLAREDVGHPEAALASLDQIQRAGLRGRHLVQQILSFSRRDQRGFAIQPLAPLIEESVALLRSLLPAGVRLEVQLPEEALTIRGDSTQLLQVLMNLCTNAWQALPGPVGRIEIGAGRLNPDAAPSQRVREMPGGEGVHLWVRDEGSGIDAAHVDRIFDPFFTTKPVGQGTGLGLSVVHGIVRAHEGAIEVETAPGRGTTFHLYFPLAQMPAVEAPGPAALPATPRAAGQRVLYVDDDEVMVLVVERLLQRAGFEVSVVSDAMAAVATVRERPEAFDAVVTDFNMPGLSGLEVAALIAGIRPALPVVISSGHITKELRQQALQLGVRALMHKENTFEELAALLLQVLAREPA